MSPVSLLYYNTQVKKACTRFMEVKMIRIKNFTENLEPEDYKLYSTKNYQLLLYILLQV